MEELKELKERLEHSRPETWEALPDISLYMDQLIGYMPRQLIQYREGEALTSAMVNNYIKGGLLPRAEGKRYDFFNDTATTEICTLKQVLPVPDAGTLAAVQEGREVAESYEEFRSALDLALKETAGRLDAEAGEEDLPRLALELALRSYADKLACQRILDLIRAQEPRDEGKTKKKRKEK